MTRPRRRRPSSDEGPTTSARAFPAIAMAISMPASPAAFRAIKDSLDVELVDDGDDVRRLALCAIAVAGLPLPPQSQIDALAESLSPDIFESPLNMFTQALHAVTEQPTRPADMSEDVFLYR